MEVHRSARHRSLGIHPSPQALAPQTASKRPTLGERHRSAPLVAPIRRSQAHATRVKGFSRIDLDSQLSDQTPTVCDVQKDDQDLNLVVLGNARVGKTIFIRSALGLEKRVSTAVASTDILLDDSYHQVQLCEIELDHVEFANGTILKWPSPIGSTSFPSVDGVLCLYDITDEDSIVGIPQALYAISKSRLPITLIACNSDAHISEQEVGIAFIERVRRSFPLVLFAETASNSKESAKHCLGVAIKAVTVMNKLTASIENDLSGSDWDATPKMARVRTTDYQQSAAFPFNPEDLVPDREMTLREAHARTYSSTFGTITSQDSYHQNVTVQDGTPDASNSPESVQEFPQLEDESPDELLLHATSKLEHLTLQRTHLSDGAEGGIPFSDLVDRLLQMPATKNESKFVPAFLCLYRLFATPKRLLVDIIDRFETTEQSDLVPLTKVAELLRYLQVLAQWTANYPGDFAGSSTRRLAIQFAHELEQSKNFTHAAREIIGNLLTIIMDDDRDWAYEDPEDFDKPDSRRTTRSSISMPRIDSITTAESDQSDNDRDARRRSVRNSIAGSTTSSIMRSSLASSQSATNLFNLDNAREQSKQLKAVPHIPVGKVQWHQFMAMPTEELAREITRMDWTMYSAIRARDFVRHVSLPSQKRVRSRHADTIGMMVKHFNHLALFVSGMILFREKPKHRARILEKFMDLAWKVRQLNNYNSLGAIVAGITGPEITRLRQTRELVPSDVQKQFLRLTVLMSTSRSYAAYRMAWDNSFSERIPFIPLVRQDLTKAASGNSTFFGQNINWKKFEIMGDVIVSIQRSHDQPYSFPDKTLKSLEITRLILDTKVIEEAEDSADPRSELWDRSVQLEVSTNGDSRKSMANLGVRRTMTGWFQS